MGTSSLRARGMGVSFLGAQELRTSRNRARQARYLSAQHFLLEDLFNLHHVAGSSELGGHTLRIGVCAYTVYG